MAGTPDTKIWWVYADDIEDGIYVPALSEAAARRFIAGDDNEAFEGLTAQYTISTGNPQLSIDALLDIKAERAARKMK